MTWKVSSEVMWREEPEIQATRKLSGWSKFHRECGKLGLYFDHMSRDSRRGPWSCDAYTLRNLSPVFLVKGKGKTVVDAVLDAFRRSSIPVPAAAGLLDDPTDDFNSLMEPATVVDEFEGLM